MKRKRNKPQTQSIRKEISIFLSSGYKRFIFTTTLSDMNIALTRSWGIFIENSLQLSSAPVKLQKRSQRGDFTAQLAVSCSSPGVFVNTAAPYNWHNCQVSATNKLGVLLASADHVIKGTCFWRCSRGHVTRNHVGATVRLIKWLPLISSVHMKGLCHLHDRFYAASPRDLLEYSKPAAIAYRAVMYGPYVCD